MIPVDDSQPDIEAAVRVAAFLDARKGSRTIDPYIITGHNDHELRTADLRALLADLERASDVLLIRAAINDPGRFTKRREEYTETLASWCARAVVAALSADGDPEDVGEITVALAEAEAALQCRAMTTREQRIAHLVNEEGFTASEATVIVNATWTRDDDLPIGSIVAYPNGSVWLLRSDGWYLGDTKQPGAGEFNGAVVLRRGWAG